MNEETLACAAYLSCIVHTSPDKFFNCQVNIAVIKYDKGIVAAQLQSCMCQVLSCQLGCADAHLGTVDQPYVLQMSGATVIDQIKGDLADVILLEVIDNAGRTVKKTANPTSLPVFDKSEYHSADIYNIRLTYRSGETKVFRITM